MIDAHVRLGRALAGAGRVDEAVSAFERALATDAAHESTLLALYELEQLRGNAAAAVAYQARVLARTRLFSRVAPHEERRVLALLAPGDLKANAPLELVLDADRTTLHRYYVTAYANSDELPPADVAFVAIGESPEAAPALERAAALIRKLRVPVVNVPRNVPRTNRVQLAQLVAGIPRCSMPSVTRCARDELYAYAEPHGRGAKRGGALTRPDGARAASRGENRAVFPLVVRPEGSQAGEHFACVEDDAALAKYLRETPGDAFFVSPFVDYRNIDGFYRKYRIVVIDGGPYPYHLAISPQWMVHYYTTPMSVEAWMRAEEERFLAGDHPAAAPHVTAALRELARRLELDYFGVDCTLDPGGDLLIFEADTAMIVHLADSRELFPYKHVHVPRIFAAVERMIDARIARA